MTQFPLLWIERRNYPSFRNINGLGFDPDYEQWWEDYKRVVTELHRERYQSACRVRWPGVRGHCKQNGIVPDQEALRRYTPLEGNGICGVTRG